MSVFLRPSGNEALGEIQAGRTTELAGSAWNDVVALAACIQDPAFGETPQRRQSAKLGKGRQRAAAATGATCRARRVTDRKARATVFEALDDIGAIRHGTVLTLGAEGAIGAGYLVPASGRGTNAHERNKRFDIADALAGSST